MVLLLDHFFNKDQSNPTILISEIVNYVGKLVEEDYNSFFNSLSQVINKDKSEDVTLPDSHKIKNITALISHVDKNYTIIYKVNSKSRVQIDPEHAVKHAYHGTIFIRNILQITCNHSVYDPLFLHFPTHLSELPIVIHYLISSIKLVIKLEAEPKNYNLIVEVLSILNIICFCLNQKTELFGKLKQIIFSKNSNLIRCFFLKLLKISVLNIYSPDSTYNRILSGAKHLLNSLTLNMANFSSQSSKMSQLTKHSQFLLLFMNYGFGDSNGSSRCFLIQNFTESDGKTSFKIEETLVEPVENSDKKVSRKTSSSSVESVQISVCFSEICNFITKFGSAELPCFLLYSLIKNNSNFKSYFLNFDKVDLFILELAQNLYLDNLQTFHFTCVLLIILLTFTTNKDFVNYLHAKDVSKMGWFKEETRCSDWNVANVILFILLKNLKQPNFCERDEFTQDNHLANISNLCFGQIRLNSETSRSIVNAFDSFALQYTKIMKEMENSETVPLKKKKNVSFLEKVLCTLAQLINMCLTDNVIANTDLIHQILLMNSSLEGLSFLQNNQKFKEEMANIITVLNFFSHKFTQLQNSKGSLGPSDVRNCIQHHARNSSILLSTTKLYTSCEFEEDTSQTFFISYLRILFENQDFFNT